MKKFGVILAAIAIAIFSSLVAAHCEIPCGIYGDRMRVDQLREHFRTIEKSMKQVKGLQAQDEINYNQLIRWVNNKDLHADKVQKIVYQYFMNQRIKPVEDADAEGYDKYVKEVTLLHKMLVQAMKCKQTTAVGHVENLRKLVDAFAQSYFEEKAEDEEEAPKKGHGRHGHDH
ncbi:MAG: superoxide dismutase [Ni] [Lentisphaeria bacterium]